jgi:hypothetical protein
LCIHIYKYTYEEHIYISVFKIHIRKCICIIPKTLYLTLISFCCPGHNYACIDIRMSIYTCKDMTHMYIEKRISIYTCEDIKHIYRVLKIHIHKCVYVIPKTLYLTLISFCCPGNNYACIDIRMSIYTCKDMTHIYIEKRISIYTCEDMTHIHRVLKFHMHKCVCLIPKTL